MAAIMTAFAAAALVLLLQAIHVVKTGSLQWFFISAPPRGKSNAGSRSNKLQGALWYGLPGCALLLFLVDAAVNHGKSAILAWRGDDWGNIVGGLILFGGGLSMALWPRWMLKGIQAQSPDVDLKIESGLVRAFMRVLGAVGMAAGLSVLSVVK